MSEIRTILAYASATVRGTLAMLLDLEPDITIIGDYADGESALAAVHALRPRVALLSGDDLGRRTATDVAQRTTGTKILIHSGLTAHPVAANDSVAGYVARTAPGSRIAEAIRIVARGGRYLDPDLAYDDDRSAVLTSHERSVLTAATRGGTVREIADSVGISLEAVGLAMNSLLAKTGGLNRLEATRIAITRGWI